MTAETKHITLTWKGGLVFRGGEPGGPETTVDGDNVVAPGRCSPCCSRRRHAPARTWS
jgi:hypothetical protein